MGILSCNSQYKDYCAYLYRLICILHTHSVFKFDLYTWAYKLLFFNFGLWTSHYHAKVKTKVLPFKKIRKISFSVTDFRNSSHHMYNIYTKWFSDSKRRVLFASFLLLEWGFKHGAFKARQLLYCYSKWSYSIIYCYLRQSWKSV